MNSKIINVDFSKPKKVSKNKTNKVVSIVTPEALLRSKQIKLEKYINSLENHFLGFNDKYKNIEDLYLNYNDLFNVAIYISSVINKTDHIEAVLAIPNGGNVLATMISTILEIPIILPAKNKTGYDTTVTNGNSSYSVNSQNIKDFKNVIVIDDKTSVGICTKLAIDLCEKLDLNPIAFAYFECEIAKLSSFEFNTGIKKDKIISIIQK